MSLLFGFCKPPTAARHGRQLSQQALWLHAPNSNSAAADAPNALHVGSPCAACQLQAVMTNSPVGAGKVLARVGHSLREGRAITGEHLPAALGHCCCRCGVAAQRAVGAAAWGCLQQGESTQGAKVLKQRQEFKQ